MPTPDLDERFRRWLKLIAEMHDGANFTANQTISWTPLRKPLSECSVALVSTAGVHLKNQPAHDLLNPHGDASFREIPGNTLLSNVEVDHVHYDTTAPIVAELKFVILCQFSRSPFIAFPLGRCWSHTQPPLVDADLIYRNKVDLV
jgi:hypothetical protein